MKFQTLAALVLIAVINLTIGNTFGQTTAPVISYTAPAAYTVNSAITPLSPTLSGGASVNGGFGVPVTVAGGGSPGGVASGAAECRNDDYWKFAKKRTLLWGAHLDKTHF